MSRESEGAVSRVLNLAGEQPPLLYAMTMKTHNPETYSLGEELAAREPRVPCVIGSSDCTSNAMLVEYSELDSIWSTRQRYLHEEMETIALNFDDSLGNEP
jgi:hypothetical protein